MRVCVLGVGLIGGSVGLAARKRLGAQVVGWDPDPAAGEAARLRGAIDAVAAPEAADADLWVCAAPIGALGETVRTAIAHARPDAIVTDVGSVKHALVATHGDAEPFVGGHPLAGAETGGVAGAREDLFDGATWYLTPTTATSGERYERLHQFVSSLGAVPQAIEAAEHDRLMAVVSHLPHLLANVLVLQAAEALGGDVLPPTGSSFRDATRVAGANPDLWDGIYAANASALKTVVDDAIAKLRAAADQLDDLRAWQEAAAVQRRALLEVGLQGGPTDELRVSVPNRPGVVADLALALGRAGINIADMSLAPAADRRTGVVGLWVAASDAGRARELISGRGLDVA